MPTFGRSRRVRASPANTMCLTEVRDRLAVTPIQYRRVAYATLAALTLIVMTGAAVRLTDSGLGCENWPKCGGTPLPPLSSHALIEFGNRAVSAVVGIITVVAARARVHADARTGGPRDPGAPAAARRRCPGGARRVHGAQPPGAGLRDGALQPVADHPGGRIRAGLASHVRARIAANVERPRRRCGRCED